MLRDFETQCQPTLPKFCEMHGGWMGEDRRGWRRLLSLGEQHWRSGKSRASNRYNVPFYMTTDTVSRQSFLYQRHGHQAQEKPSITNKWRRRAQVPQCMYWDNYCGGELNQIMPKPQKKTIKGEKWWARRQQPQNLQARPQVATGPSYIIQASHTAR